MRSADKKREWGKQCLSSLKQVSLQTKTKLNKWTQRLGGFWLFFFFACSNVGAFNTQSASHTTVLFYYKVDQNRQINQVRIVSAICLHAISSTYLSYFQTKIQLSCNSFQADKHFWSCATQCFRPERCCKQAVSLHFLKPHISNFHMLNILPKVYPSQFNDMHHPVFGHSFLLPI